MMVPPSHLPHSCAWQQLAYSFCSLLVASVLSGVSKLALPQSWYHFTADTVILVSYLLGAIPTSLREGNGLE